MAAWKKVGMFTAAGTTVYFNEGTTKAGAPMLSINTVGRGDYRSRTSVFDSTGFLMIENLIKAVKVVFGMDYIAYLKASGTLPEDGEEWTAEDQAEVELAEESYEAGRKQRVVSTAELTDDGKSCLRCGNEPGDNWKFTLGAAICGVCGKVYRS